MADRFVRLPGKARNYLDTETGVTYSRRQYDKLAEKTRHAPAKSPERRKREAVALKGYNHIVETRTSALRAEGKQVSRRDVRNDPHTHALIKELAKAEKRTEKYTRGKRKGQYKPRSGAQNARLKEILTELGLRNGVPSWVKPGESAKYKKGLMHRK